MHYVSRSTSYLHIWFTAVSSFCYWNSTNILSILRLCLKDSQKKKKKIEPALAYVTKFNFVFNSIYLSQFVNFMFIHVTQMMQDDDETSFVVTIGGRSVSRVDWWWRHFCHFEIVKRSTSNSTTSFIFPDCILLVKPVTKFNVSL